MKQKNMNRYKKILSCVLIVCLCLGVIPTYVLNTRAAEETEQTVFSELTESDMQYQMNQLVKEGYRVVTPMTFGLKDLDYTTAQSGKADFSLDKVLFSVNMTYKATATATANFFYLSGSATENTRFCKLGIRGAANRIYVYNQFDSVNQSVMYRGESGTDTKEYGTNNYLQITPPKSITGRDFQLWITTEFVKAPWLPEGEAADDLKIGFWIDGELCKNFYVLDCKQNKYFSHVQNGGTNLSLSSPIMELDHMGMVGGEYTSAEGGSHTTPTLVASKNMNNTTFQTGVRFEGEGGTLYYGSSDVNSAVQFTSTANGIQVLYGGDTLGWITKDNVGIDVLNNNFDLKLTTKDIDSDSDGTADKAELDICVNNKHTSFELNSLLSAYVGVKTEGDATVLVGDFASEEPEQISWDLDNGSYTITKTETMTRLSVNGKTDGEEIVDGNIVLTEPGTYSVAITDNDKVYMKDVTIQEKFANLESEMPKGYRVVTPLTFSVPDTEYAAVATASEDKEEISIDKLLFSANITHKGESNALFYYLKRDSNSTFWQMRLTDANRILIWNTFDTRMYIGDAENAGIIYTAAETKADTTLKNTKQFHPTNDFGITNFEGEELQIWITTEFVDMEYNDPDNDKEADDLKIGFYVNGILYQAVNGAKGTYLYVPNAKQITYNEYVEVTTAQIKIASPIMDINNMGMVGGEYSSADGESYTSDLVANKFMSVKDGTTFQTSVRFEGEGGTLYYGSNDVDKAVQLTSTADSIELTYAGKKLELINKDNVGVDVLNNNIDLKLITKAIDGNANDMQLDVCIGDKYKSYTLEGAASTLKAYVGVKTTGDATVLVGEFGNDEPEKVYWCLDNGAYTKTVTSSITRLSVNGTVPEVFELTEPGSYGVAVTKNGKIYMEDVIVYIAYDINGNQKVEITDLVRMLKVENEATHEETIANLNEVQRKAIGYKNPENWAATAEYGKLVLGFMREALVGGTPMVTKEKEVTTIDVNQLTQFKGSHGAYTNDFSIQVSELDFLNDIWLLTCKAKYISVNGKQPTMAYKIIDAEGDALYTSPAYVVGEENESVLRQWRVMSTKEDYSTVEINIVIPDGVALFIDEFYNTGKDNVLVTRTDANIEYASHTGLRYAPTNTKEAFEWAGEVGYDRLITIVKFTKPTDTNPLGVPVCFHDDDYIHGLLRLKDGSAITSSSEYYNKPIEDFTYEELITNFSAGWKMNEIYGDAIVPTLEDFFEVCKTYGMDPIFSVHPNLTIEQWTYVKELLVEYGLLENFYVKSGDLGTLQDTFSVFGFEIGGYQILVGKNSNNNPYTIAKKVGLVDNYGEVNFAKVEAEFFNTNPNLLDLIEKAKSNGFERISLYCEDKCNGSDFTQYMELGVNEFNVDYHASIGLNW